MKFELINKEMFPMAIIDVDPNDTIRIQTGSMVYHTGDTELNTKLNAKKGGSGLGRTLAAMGRSMVSGESMFMTQITSGPQGGKVALAPNAPGTIFSLDIGQEHFRLNDGAFLAMDDEVEYTMVRQSLGKAVFGKTGGLFVMETSGTGTMLCNTFGSLIKIDLDGSDTISIDNDHVVAWSTSLSYNMALASKGLLNSVGTGEGLVNTFNGAGTVYVQSLNVSQFAGILGNYIATGN